MPSANTTIRNKIYTKLQAITSIQEVSTNPKATFTGYPAAIVSPSETNGDYETNAENQRIYAFNVQLLYEVQGTALGTALDALYEVADEIMDAFDKDPNFTGISLPADYTMLTVIPSLGGWSEIPDTQLVQIVISIKTAISFDFT